MLKKFVGISLFIFWSIAVAVLVAGLVFYQNNKTSQNAAAVPGGATNQTTGAHALTIMEVAKHNSISDCWMVISNKVYNVSNYAIQHPGGVETIAAYCGKEATVAFDTKDRPNGRGHSSQAQQMLEQYYIGDLSVK